MFHFVQNGAVYCWGMPQMLDQAFIPQIWTPVPQAAIDYRWRTMTGDAATACLSVPVPRTLGGVFFSIDGGFNQKIIRVVIPSGIPCGEKVGDGITHVVEYSGFNGVANCL